MDNIWDEAEFEEIEDVEDVYYEVEQITPPSGSKRLGVIMKVDQIKENNQ